MKTCATASAQRLAMLDNDNQNPAKRQEIFSLSFAVPRAYASKFPETTPYFEKYGGEIHPTKSAIP
jgi:hypothetical protein